MDVHLPSLALQAHHPDASARGQAALDLFCDLETTPHRVWSVMIKAGTGLALGVSINSLSSRCTADRR